MYVGTFAVRNCFFRKLNQGVALRSAARWQWQTILCCPLAYVVFGTNVQTHLSMLGHLKNDVAYFHVLNPRLWKVTTTISNLKQSLLSNFVIVVY